jgi:hypothetical protein
MSCFVRSALFAIIVCYSCTASLVIFIYMQPLLALLNLVLKSVCAMSI